MIETWFQWTCNGCGEAENYPMPSVPKSEVREYLEKRGWQHFPGDLDYCPRCVKNGAATPAWAWTCPIPPPLALERRLGDQAVLTSLSKSGCRSNNLNSLTNASGGLVLPFS